MEFQDSTPLRTCTKCGEAKTLEGFHRRKGLKYGHNSVCKACTLSHYQANKESVLEAARRSYAAREEAKRLVRESERAKRLAAPHKRCACCSAVKDKSEFAVSRNNADGRYAYCKECHSVKSRIIRRANPEKVSARNIKWQRDNPEKAKAKQDRWNKTEKGKATRKARRELPQHRIHTAIASSLRRKMRKNGRGSFDILGYSIAELRAHLERQFLNGMTWENYGAWEIDHIQPLASFKITGPSCHEVRRAWGLPNLRPLWAEDNLRKRDKLLFLL